MTEAPLKATLKGGRDYDAPWLTVDAETPEDLATRLKMLAASGAVEAVVEVANLFKGVNNAAPLLTGGQEAAAAPQAAPQPSPWGGGQQAPQQAPQAPPGRPTGQLHPEGKACHCGNVLERKATQSGKAKWQCPDWRWNNGNPNGHAMEWINGR